MQKESEMIPLSDRNRGPRQDDLATYLKKCVSDGRQFFKSKYIARDLGMTPKEVGTYMNMLAGRYKELRIERWSYSRSTTWYVEYGTATL